MKSLLQARLVSRLLLAAGGIAVATAALAQTVEDNVVPDTGLNIPSNLQVFGKRDPNVRKPTAIVNDAVITGTDVDQRMALIIASNDLKLDEAQRDQLRLRVLGSLIDETLQIEYAKHNDVTVKSEEIDRAFNGIARSFNKPISEFRTYLRQIGSSDQSIRRQVEAELYWNRYLRRRVEPTVNVGDAEVEAILDRLKSSQGTEEFHVREIFLRASPEQQEQVLEEARTLMQDIQAGKKRFDEAAYERSDTSTRAVGGDLGWVTADKLPDSLAEAANLMKANQLAGPVPVAGGYSILYLEDTRRVGEADPRDAQLSLRQLSLAFPADITQAEASNRVAEFAKATQGLKGCGDAGKAAAAIGATVVDNDSVKLRDLPPALQEIMLNMKVGEATPPFGSPSEGVRALVVCGRTEVQQASMPSMEQVRNQMEQRGVNLKAEHLLRDLRRDAIVEYR